MVQWFSGNSGENEERGIPPKVFPFSRKISCGKTCSIWFPTGKTDFSIQMESAQGFFQNQHTNRTRWRLPFVIRFLVIVFGWWETGNWEIYQMVRKFPSFRSEWEKRSTFDGTPQFPNGISGKLPYHFTSNRNFRIFSGILPCILVTFAQFITFKPIIL